MHNQSNSGMSSAPKAAGCSDAETTTTTTTAKTTTTSELSATNGDSQPPAANPNAAAATATALTCLVIVLFAVGTFVAYRCARRREMHRRRGRRGAIGGTGYRDDEEEPFLAGSRDASIELQDYPPTPHGR